MNIARHKPKNNFIKCLRFKKGKLIRERYTIYYLLLMLFVDIHNIKCYGLKKTSNIEHAKQPS